MSEKSVTVEFWLAPTKITPKPLPGEKAERLRQQRAARRARNLALAYYIDELIRSGEVKDLATKYASEQIRQIMAANHIEVSMSRTGNCYDNAVMESFFSTLKCEQVHHQNYKTRTEASRDIFDYIAGFYNTVRRHSTLGYLSPNQFEANLQNSP